LNSKVKEKPEDNEKTEENKLMKSLANLNEILKQEIWQNER
jgi:hypothetical protein